MSFIDDRPKLQIMELTKADFAPDSRAKDRVVNDSRSAFREARQLDSFHCCYRKDITSYTDI